jgi:hypothetical protein
LNELDLKAQKASKSTNHSSGRTGSHQVKVLTEGALIAQISAILQVQYWEEIEK